MDWLPHPLLVQPITDGETLTLQVQVSDDRENWRDLSAPMSSLQPMIALLRDLEGTGAPHVRVKLVVAPRPAARGDGELVGSLSAIVFLKARIKQDEAGDADDR